jgi:hypothetical protein
MQEKSLLCATYWFLDRFNEAAEKVYTAPIADVLKIKRSTNILTHDKIINYGTLQRDRKRSGLFFNG